jgi:hypothetical protein
LDDLDIVLPLSVTVVESGSMVPLAGKTIGYKRIEEIRVEEGAFASNDTANSVLMQKEGSVELEKISFQVTHTSVVTRVYSVNGTEEYLGKRVESPNLSYYDSNGNEVTSGTDEYDDLIAALDGEATNVLKITNIDSSITLDFATTLQNSTSGKAIHAFRMVFYEEDGILTAEAKAYDENGVLFSKGSITSVQSIISVNYPV